MYIGSSIYDSVEPLNNNEPLAEGSIYNTSFTNDLILVFIPDADKTETRLYINYIVQGTVLFGNWWENLIFNEDKSFKPFFYVACVCGGLIVILIFTGIIIAICKGCSCGDKISTNSVVSMTNKQAYEQPE